jgi:hypothetical protein
MAGEEKPGAPRSLNAADAFEMFVWLQGPYTEVAAATDFLSLSSFEQWERLRQYVEKVGYLLGKKNVSSLDEVANQSKAKLLQWLEENRLRSPGPAASPNAAPSHRMLQSKLLR